VPATIRTAKGRRSVHMPLKTPIEATLQLL
jgi:hypothetical protein